MSDCFQMDSLADDPQSGVHFPCAGPANAYKTDWVEDDLNSLWAAYRTFRHRPDEEAVLALKDVFQDFHEMGKLFGYKLASKVGQLAADFLEGGLAKSAQEIELVHALISTLELAVAERRSNRSNAALRGMIKELDKALKRARRRGGHE